jgi:DNA topoisomerase IA
MARCWTSPVTRAAIIETPLERGYITREKKTLLATDLAVTW